MTCPCAAYFKAMPSCPTPLHCLDCGTSYVDGLPMAKPLPPDVRASRVLAWLVEQPSSEWFSARDVALCAGVNGTLVYNALSTLCGSGDVITRWKDPTQYQASPKARGVL